MPLSGATNIDDVANFLGIRANFLRFVLYGRQDRKRYRRFTIPKKSGGLRKIAAPPESLRIMQRKLANALLDLYPVKPSAHGFLRNRSIVSNAIRHEGQRVVGNVDLLDFFPTIHIGRVARALEKPPYLLTEDAALVVAQICCDDAGCLPQGAPTSPILSNIVCRHLDDQLQQLSRRFGCRYTRYADDITLSTSRPTLPIELLDFNPVTKKAVVGTDLGTLIAGAGFAVNHEKVRVARSDRRQEVTGLTVNERTNVERRFIRELDSLVHIWWQHGPTAAADSYGRHHKLPSKVATPGRLLGYLQGKLSYLIMVKGLHDRVVRRLQWNLADLANSNVSRPIDIAELPSAALRGHLGQFRGWQVLVNRYAQSVKLVEVKIGQDLHCGSAFVIDSNCLVTAGHIVSAGPVRVGHGDAWLYPSHIHFKDTPTSLDFALLYFDAPVFSNLPRFEFQHRLPEIGENVAALGFPQIARRYPDVILHTGTVEGLPKSYSETRFIQTSFASGGGLSGSPLIDQRGFAVGLMLENAFMQLADRSHDNAKNAESNEIASKTTDGERWEIDKTKAIAVPPRPYGQALPFEYVSRIRSLYLAGGKASLQTAGIEIVEHGSSEGAFGVKAR